MSRRPTAAASSRPPRAIRLAWLASLLIGALAIALTTAHTRDSAWTPADMGTLVTRAVGPGATDVSIAAAYGSALDGHWEILATVDWRPAHGARRAATWLIASTSGATATITAPPQGELDVANPAQATTTGESVAAASRLLSDVGQDAAPDAMFTFDGSAGTFVRCAGATALAQCISVGANGHAVRTTTRLHVVTDLGADAVQIAPSIDTPSLDTPLGGTPAVASP